MVDPTHFAPPFVMVHVIAVAMRMRSSELDQHAVLVSKLDQQISRPVGRPFLESG